MDSVAVGGLDQQDVGQRNGSRILQDRAVEPAEIAAKHDPRPPASVICTAAAPSKCPIGTKLISTPGRHGDRAVIAKRLQLRDGPPCVGDRVERQRRVMARVAVAIGLTGVFLLQMRGVGQHQPSQIERPGRAEHPPAEALRHQSGQVADVVQVRVGQDEGVDVPGGHRQVGPVAQAEFLVALKQSGVDQHLMRSGIHEVFRTGDRLRRAEEGQGGHGDNYRLRLELCRPLS